jgi:site-specific DNA-adenine methylase
VEFLVSLSNINLNAERRVFAVAADLILYPASYRRAYWEKRKITRRQIEYNYSKALYNLDINFEYIRARLDKCNVYGLDYLEFSSAVNPVKGDFVFLDPPYFRPTSSYSSADSEKALEYIYDMLSNSPASVMAVIPKTLVYYNYFNIFFNAEYSKTYNMSRRKAVNMILTNY